VTILINLWEEYMIPLLSQHPLLKEKIPYIPLGEFPTPIEHMVKLGAEKSARIIYI
jgi:hypothetical protein